VFESKSTESRDPSFDSRAENRTGDGGGVSADRIVSSREVFENKTPFVATAVSTKHPGGPRTMKLLVSTVVEAANVKEDGVKIVRFVTWESQALTSRFIVVALRGIESNEN